MTPQDTTSHHALPLMAPAQAQKHITHNEALVLIDSRLQLTVQSLQSEPPAEPQNGDRFAIARGAIGAWVNRDDAIAQWQDGQWQFTTARAGWRAAALETDQFLLLGPSGWHVADDRRERLGIGADADAINRLSVASPAILFNHAGDDIRIVVNRADDQSVGSIMFQTGFTGRAEIGLSA